MTSPDRTAPLFVNGEGMRGGSVHHNIAGYPFLGHVHTAARYRFFSIRDEFPALLPVGAGGAAVPGELYDVPLRVIRDAFMPDEPAELELAVVELAEGAAALAVVLRPDRAADPGLTDISDRGGWRAYRGLPTPGAD